MTTPIFKAAYCDVKAIKTRQTVQFIFEVPVTESDAAMKVLGGFPNPASEVWAAIARLDPAKIAKSSEKPASDLPTQSTPAPVEKIRRRFHELPLKQQAAMRCNEVAFQRFIGELNAWGNIPSAEETTSLVRSHCGIKSRSEIIEGSLAADLWMRLDGEYNLWMKVPV